MTEYVMAAIVILAYVIGFHYSKDDESDTESSITEKTPKGEIHAKDPEKTFYGQ